MSPNDDISIDSSQRSATESAGSISIATAGGDDLTTADFVYLGDGQCRFPYQVKGAGGSKIPIICGRPVRPGSISCACTTHQSRTATRRPTGYYRRRVFRRGNAVIAEDNEPLSEEGYAALCAMEEEERMADLAAAAENLQMDKFAASDEEEEGGNRVTIDTAANTVHAPTETEPRGEMEEPARPTVAGARRYLGHEKIDGRRSYSKNDGEEARLCKHGLNVVTFFYNLEECLEWVDQGTQGKRAKPPATPNRPAPATESPRLYLGHENKDGRRSYSHSAGEEERLCKEGWNVVAAFETLPEVLTWVRKADPVGRTVGVAAAGGSGGGGGDSVSSTSSQPKKKKKSKKSSRHHKSSHHSRGSPQKSRSTSSRRRSESVSDASWNTDTDSSSSSPSDASSSSSSSRPRKGKGSSRRRRREGRRRAKGKGDASDPIRFFSRDESTGDDKKVFGMSITEKVLERALCPDGMHSDDRKGLASCFTDVTAMPGAYRKTSVEKTDMETVFEGAVNIIAQATGKNAVIADGQWRTTTKARLRTVKAVGDLMTMNEEIHQTQTEIFEQQDDSVRTFLHRLHYSSAEIKEYLATGLWHRIISDSFANYVHLLQTIIHLANTHGFAGGMAERMLTYHANQLLQIRLYSPNFTRFQIRTYIYLRDAKVTNFDHLSIYRPLMQDIMDKAGGDMGEKERAMVEAVEPGVLLARLPAHTARVALHMTNAVWARVMPPVPSGRDVIALKRRRRLSIWLLRLMQTLRSTSRRQSVLRLLRQLHPPLTRAEPLVIRIW